MQKALLPLNLSLLNPSPEQLRRLRQVTTLDIFDGPGGNFHDDGLFSTLTFGRVGDPDRDRRFGYIALRVPVFHPVVFTRLIKLKGLYADILSGKGYAKWNPEAADFEKATELDGQTGYHFFVQHFAELRPAKTGSATRDLRVQLLEKYRDKALLDNLLVMPAGLRDAEIDVDGRVSMDEINEIYQGVLMLVRNLPEKARASDDLSAYDRTRHTLTLKLVAIYEHIERLISGKGGFIQSRWASRRVFNGTRNVISSLDTSTADLDAPNRPRFNDTVIGLYQAARSVLPKTIYHLKTGLVGQVFDTTSNNVELVDPKTLKRVWVEISNEEMDRWSTEEGLDKVINELSVIDKRDKPVMIAGHYLALVYLSPNAEYKLLRSIDELPQDFNAKYVRPLTYVELIYLSGLGMWYKNSAFVTRYPVENYNSSYPTKHYVKTTVTGELRYALGDDWERDPEAPIALEYPIIKEGVVTQYHDSTSVSPARLAALGGDFDGDTVSFNSLYSKEAVDETDRFFKTRAAYVKAGGGLAFSVEIHTLALTMRFMTGPN
jgi:hypothetical protein